MTRTAISPRLAMRTFFSTLGLSNLDEQQPHDRRRALQHWHGP
jgi:hypothetical protein